jgi:hypothetical protein
MKSRYIGMGLLIMVLLMSGCAIIGKGKDYRPFDEQSLTRIKPGQTTAMEVTTLFGAPSQVVKLSNGNAYVYNRSISKVLGIWVFPVTMVNYDTQYDRLVFFINPNDVVTHYGSSFKADASAYGTPFK